MKSRLIYITALAISIASASPQAPDKLVEDGTNRWVHGFALNRFMRKAVDDFQYRHSRGPDGALHGVGSTANARGFYADLELRDNRLYLVKLRILNPLGSHDKDTYLTVPLSLLRAGTMADKGLLADWFSGALKEYYGNEVGYTHIRERARVLEFQKGKLKKRDDIIDPEGIRIRGMIEKMKKGQESEQQNKRQPDAAPERLKAAPRLPK